MVMTDQEKAHAAIEWGSSKNLDCARNNFEVFQAATTRHAKAQGEFESLKHMENLFPGFSYHYWQCLLRLLILGDPQLICYAIPSYIKDLDSHSGSLWFRTEYYCLTGKNPAVASWRAARQEVIG